MRRVPRCCVRVLGGAARGWVALGFRWVAPGWAGLGCAGVGCAGWVAPGWVSLGLRWVGLPDAVGHGLVLRYDNGNLRPGKN